MAPNTSISLAKTSDARALAALRMAVADDMTRQFGKGDWSAGPSTVAVVRQVRASHVLLARQGESIVGTVRLTAARPWAIDASCFTPVSSALYVLGLAVAPDCRGFGIGRQLMEAAKDAARAWPAQALWLDAYDNAAGAGSFDMKCGFRQVGRTKFREMPLVYYEWVV